MERLSRVKLRLHQFLSKTGRFASKQEAKDAVWAGRITVGGRVAKDIAFQFNPATKAVCLDGERLVIPDEHLTLLLNKPVGFVCARLSPQEIALGKSSVFDLVKEDLSEVDYDRMVCVGRLDEATTGLLLLTTDGLLVHRLANPAHHVSKTYRVVTDAPLDRSAVERLQAGLDIELEVDGTVTTYRTQPAVVSILGDASVRIVISEGKKRQVRRMFSAVGATVLHLHREAMANLNLTDYGLQEGEWVALNVDELLTHGLQTVPDKRP